MVERWCRRVFLVSDVSAPRRSGALLVGLEHGEVGHEARRRGAVPVVLARLEEHAVAGPDHLDRSASPLTQANSLGDPDGLAVGMRVPRRSRPWCEVDAARSNA